MAILKYSNNAHTTLQSTITSGATSLTVASGTGALFPTTTGGYNFYITILDAATLTTNEIVKVTSRSGDVFTVVRAQQSTTAVGWAAGSVVAQLITAGDLTTFVQQEQLPIFGTTTYPLTMDSSGSGATPSTTFNGSAAQTISYNTLGAMSSLAFSGSNVNLAGRPLVSPSSGYQKFPSGLWMQWGTTYAAAGDNSYSVTFPIAFPNAVFNIQLTANNNNLNYRNDTWAQLGNTITTTSFNYFYQQSYDNSSVGGYVNWLALGY